MGWDGFGAGDGPWCVAEPGCSGGRRGGPRTARVVLGKVPFEGERGGNLGWESGAGLWLLTPARASLRREPGELSLGRRGICGNKAPFRKFIVFFSKEKGKKEDEIISLELSRPALLRNLHPGPLGKSQAHG